MAKKVCVECGEYERHWGRGLCETCYRRTRAHERKAEMNEAELAAAREVLRLRMARWRAQKKVKNSC